MDKRVEIHSTSRAGMNGKRGVATDFQTVDGETVQLETSEGCADRVADFPMASAVHMNDTSEPLRTALK